MAAAISHKPEPLQPFTTECPCGSAESAQADRAVRRASAHQTGLVRGESNVRSRREGDVSSYRETEMRSNPTFQPLADSADVPLASVLSASHVTHFLRCPDPVQ